MSGQPGMGWQGTRSSRWLLEPHYIEQGIILHTVVLVLEIVNRLPFTEDMCYHLIVVALLKQTVFLTLSELP